MRDIGVVGVGDDRLTWSWSDTTRMSWVSMVLVVSTSMVSWSCVVGVINLNTVTSRVVSVVGSDHEVTSEARQQAAGMALVLVPACQADGGWGGMNPPTEISAELR